MMNDIDAKAIGQRVRDVRAKHDLKQAEMARPLAISAAELSHYETGRRVLPLEVAVRFARIHRVSLDWLYGLQPTNRRAAR